jgi:hypothetical protein
LSVPALLAWHQLPSSPCLANIQKHRSSEALKLVSSAAFGANYPEGVI